MSGSFQLWLDTVHEITGPTDNLSLLDLCCGEMSVTRLLPWKKITCVDAVDYPNRPNIPNCNFIKQDVMMIPVSWDNFDVSICSDGLEHFDKYRGMLLLDRMMRWSRTPIVFTPLGQPLSELEPYSQHPDAHKSSWKAEDFHEFGFKTKEFPDWHPTLGWGALFAWKPISK